MNVKVQLFAGARDCVGEGRVSLDLTEDATVADLREHLVQQYPKLGPIVARSMLAIDAHYATDDYLLRGTDEIALIPPVSGG